jgi:hypothetical protein
MFPCRLVIPVRFSIVDLASLFPPHLLCTYFPTCPSEHFPACLAHSLITPHAHAILPHAIPSHGFSAHAAHVCPLILRVLLCTYSESAARSPPHCAPGFLSCDLTHCTVYHINHVRITMNNTRHNLRVGAVRTCSLRLLCLRIVALGRLNAHRVLDTRKRADRKHEGRHEHEQANEQRGDEPGRQ